MKLLLHLKVWLSLFSPFLFLCCRWFAWTSRNAYQQLRSWWGTWWTARKVWTWRASEQPAQQTVFSASGNNFKSAQWKDYAIIIRWWISVIYRCEFHKICYALKTYASICLCFVFFLLLVLFSSVLFEERQPLIFGMLLICAPKTIIFSWSALFIFIFFKTKAFLMCGSKCFFFA